MCREDRTEGGGLNLRRKKKSRSRFGLPPDLGTEDPVGNPSFFSCSSCPSCISRIHLQRCLCICVCVHVYMYKKKGINKEKREKGRKKDRKNTVHCVTPFFFIELFLSICLYPLHLASGNSRPDFLLNFI